MRFAMSAWMSVVALASAMSGCAGPAGAGRMLTPAAPAAAEASSAEAKALAEGHIVTKPLEFESGDRDYVGGIATGLVQAAPSDVLQALDDADAMGEQPYTLEVTSPGVDRPLTLPRHWRRNVGRKVAVTTTDQTRRTGRIRAVGETSVTLDVGGTEVEMPYDDITKALVQVEFNRKEG